MHNFFTIETESELHRQELERAAAADARAAQASRANGNTGRLTLAFRSLPKFPTLVLPRTSIGAPLELRRVPRPVEC